MSTASDLLLRGWSFHPIVAVAVAAFIAMHVVLRGFGHPARTLALAGFIAAVVLALCSPIDALARGTLFSAHMAQHMLLVLAAPPLALLALPRAPGDPSTRPLPWQRSTGRSLPWQRLPRLPAFACWAMGVGAMWLWHAPVLCNAAATGNTVRAVQTVSLLVMGAAFWSPLIGPRLDRRLPDGTAITYLVTACLACTLLGVAIAFSPVEVCAAYAHPADPLGALALVRGWGLTPAVDQQLGGLLMWVPGCAVYAGAILGVLARFHGASDANTEAAS